MVVPAACVNVIVAVLILQQAVLQDARFSLNLVRNGQARQTFLFSLCEIVYVKFD